MHPPSPGRALEIREERLRFARLRATGSQRDREELVRRYLPLARTLAARYRGSDEPLDDLVQVACLGLVHAVDRFDPGRGTAFSSFAVPTILGELRRHFRDRTWALRVPRDAQELYLRIERARDDMAVALGREPTVAELAVRLDASEDAIVRALDLTLAYRALPLDTLEAEDQPDAPPGALDNGYELAEDRAVLATLLGALSPEESEVVMLRYHEDLTQDAIAQRMGVSQMQISRILRRTLARLRQQAAA